jgi:23S rRNA (uracil1939-C5)-methyltransferase
MECKHFGLCGGCRCESDSSNSPHPAPYAQELLQKEKRVRELLAPFEVEAWRPIVPSPDEWHYRNKMEFAFAVWDDQLVLGLRAEGRFDRIINLDTCGLISDESLEVLKRVRRWALEKGLKGYHRRRHEGDLRYMVIREGKNTGDRMVVLIATSKAVTPADAGVYEDMMDPGLRRDDMLGDLRKSIEPLITTAWLGVTDSKSDVARADDMRLLWGPGAITEKVIARTYRISPYSFFQTNTHGTEKLYALLQEWGAQIGGTLLDLYCGSGGIALALADHFERVVGIDLNADAIEDARKNAQANGLQNTEFVCEDAHEFLKKLPGSKLSVQLTDLVVDPPRAGLHPKALSALRELNPAKLAYVSCNPESLARDLQSLVPLYRIRGAQGVDLFPHTAHVETVVFLEHR